MTRTTVWIPDELLERVRAERPDLNLSAIVQGALRELLDCPHDTLVCSACGELGLRDEIERAALGRFWRAVAVRLEPLIDRRGTAEGAARLVREVAVAHGVIPAAAAPAQRPPRRAGGRRSDRLGRGEVPPWPAR